MAASELYKRTFYFLVVAGSITVILLLFPVVESWRHDYVVKHFGYELTNQGVLAPKTGEGAPDMMTVTGISLFENIIRILKIIIWMILVISIIRMLTYLIFEAIWRNANQSEISSLIKTVLSMVLYIVSFFIIFQSQYPEIQLAPLFTGSAILGIVVGLALQDTLGNLFAGIALQADQPFQVGDVISITNRGSGVVESVSWRGVKIRTFQSKLLIISNAVLGKETIEVAPQDNLNARLVFFNTLYTNSPAKTAQIVREAVRQAENVSQKIRPVVRIRNLGDNGVEFEIKYWIDNYALYNDTDALVRQRIWYAFQREKIHFAYPTLTIHVEKKIEELTSDEYANSVSASLSRVPIFAPLSDEEMEKLAHGSTKRIFAPGETIVRKGQEGNSMFVIVSGAVKVQIPDDYGHKTVNKLKANDFFGEMSLLTGQPRTANVIAEEETEVLQIRKSAIRPLFEANPELLKLICEIIEERRSLLEEKVPDASEISAAAETGVMRSIRNFFGLK